MSLSEAGASGPARGTQLLRLLDRMLWHRPVRMGAGRGHRREQF